MKSLLYSMSIPLSNISTGRSAVMKMSKCTAGRAVDVNSNSAFIDFSLIIHSMHVAEFSLTGLDFHLAAFASAMTFHSTIVSHRGALEGLKIFSTMPLTMRCWLSRRRIMKRKKMTFLTITRKISLMIAVNLFYFKA